ncbi:hypothetical protein BgiMline_009413, partial [Biomphalaria glabrata]
ELASLGIFETKEKLEILQQQTRCVWINFRPIPFWSNNYNFGDAFINESYNDEKHKNLFYQ